MVSNFGIGRQQVPWYLSEFMAFKCYFCHVFVMCSFSTLLKLSAGQLHFLQNLEPLFITFLNLLQREEPLIHVLHNQPSELVRTIMIRFPKQSVVGEKTGKSLLYVDVDNTDNRLKHDREIEIGDPTSKTLKKLRQEQQKRTIMDMCSFCCTATRFLTRHLPFAMNYSMI